MNGTGRRHLHRLFRHIRRFDDRLAAVLALFPCPDILTRWAEENDYEIVSSERCWFWKGPFFFWSSKSQEVYYVTVRTQDGNSAEGGCDVGAGWGSVRSSRSEMGRVMRTVVNQQP